VPNVVYSCGSLLHGRELIIPYAMSDSATSFATVSLDELLAAMDGFSGRAIGSWPAAAKTCCRFAPNTCKNIKQDNRPAPS
jgi:hypothetical protein